jgi:hypothetical protein
MAAAETDGSAHADSSAPAASTITVAATGTPDAFAFGARFTGRDPVDPGLVNWFRILPGPASSLSGCDGVAGGVSVDAADPEDIAGKGHEVGGFVRLACDSDDPQATVNAVGAVRSGHFSVLAG